MAWPREVARVTAQSPVLLVVGDEAAAVDVIRRVGEQLGFRVVVCTTAGDAARLARDEHAAAAVVDLRVAGASGLDVLAAFADARPQCRAILLNGHGAGESAMEAVKRGALDYLDAPVDEHRMAELLMRVREETDQRRHLLTVESELARTLSCCGMVGRSPAMRAVFDSARRFAPHVRTGLVVGEPGSGRQSLGRALHALGPRRLEPFVVVDCAVHDPASLEAHVFGSADAARPGVAGRPALADHADRGVLYFNEVTRLTASAQSRLLRLIDHGEVMPVDAAGPHHADIVVIAGAGSDPRKHAQAGRFRSDLLSRLAVVEFTLPPLRERREDIPYLVAVLVKAMAAHLGKPLFGVAPEAEAMLLAAHWPGNVRELYAAVERACLLAEGPVVSAADVAASLPARAIDGRAGESADDGRPLSTVEREHIVRALQRAGGNKKAAARMLGVSRRALYRRLERLDLGGTISRRHRGAEEDVPSFDTDRPAPRVALSAK